MFQTLINHGHNVDDIKNNYTISQVYLYYEKTKKIELDQTRMNAIVFANCLMGTSSSNDASEARKKSTAFQKFMDSISWDTFIETAEEKQNPRTAEVTMKQLFGGVGVVPFRDRSKK